MNKMYLMGLSESATILGFHAIAARTSINKLSCYTIFI